MGLILGIVIGIIIGWHIPQPEWAKGLFDKVWTKVKGLFGK